MAKRQSDLIDFTPSAHQKRLGNLLRENTIVFVDGKAGSGKSSGALFYFALEYLRDKSKNIVVIRTPVEAGSDKIGALPGEAEEKLGPHFKPYVKILEKMIGPKFKADFNKRIFFTIPNFILGDTLEDSLILIEEAQMLSPLIMKLLLERIGKGSKVIVTGDNSQVYTQTARGGLKDALVRFFDISPSGHTIEHYQDIGYISFQDAQQQRDPIVDTIIKAYSNIN